MKHTFEDGYKRAVADVKSEMNRRGAEMSEIIEKLGLDAAYSLPGFFCNSHREYKVIETRFFKGYMAALKDIEGKRTSREEQQIKLF